MHYIEVEGLNKSFTVRKKREKGRFMREKTIVHALQDVSFHIDEGELTGYIGPNGAGKSTSVKILSGILTPDSGRATVGGLTPWTERKKHVQNIGVVFGQRMQLWWDVPILDSYLNQTDFTAFDNAALLGIDQRLQVGTAAGYQHGNSCFFHRVFPLRKW